MTQYKLGSPVFGGRGRRPAGVAFRVASPSRVSVRAPARQAGRPAHRGAAAALPAARTGCASAPRGWRAGVYRVRLTARHGGRTVRATLAATRL